MTRSTFSTTPATCRESPVSLSKRIPPEAPNPASMVRAAGVRTVWPPGRFIQYLRGGLAVPAPASLSEDRAHDGGTERCRVHAALTRVLDDHRDRHLRVLRRREAYEPPVRRPARILRGARLSRHVDTRDLRPEGERPGRLDRLHEVGRELACGRGADDLIARAPADGSQHAAAPVADLDRVVRLDLDAM